MGEPVLFVIHGIGEHTKDSIEAEVNTAATNALKRYTFWNQEKEFKDFVSIRGISYDDIFEDERDRIASKATTLRGALTGMRFVSPLLDALENVVGDTFVNTHALDVVFYAGLHCEQVRARVIAPIADALKDNNEVHILTHSMGTAVVHDALAKAFTGGFQGVGEYDGQAIKLDPQRHKIESLWMIANTSQVFKDWNPLQTNLDPMNSIVRPSKFADGCTLKYFDLLHKYDLVGQAREFKAPSKWVRNSKQLPPSFYQKIDTRNFYTSRNPHDLGQYIEDPLVSSTFLMTLLGSEVFAPSDAEIRAADDKLKSITENAQDIIYFATKEINDLKDGEGLKKVKRFEMLVKKVHDFLTRVKEL
ncbi:hypothetical protein ACPV5O_05020 [Vibrio maritimus]|uniref:hypothetical protein n=1 Tax=Vibrio maritimus TaxID=990268 RepID=UPI004068822D